LLDLDPMVTEAASQQLGPSNVILGRDEELEACFTVICRHIEERVVLQSTLDADHEDRLQVWLSVERGEQFAQRILVVRLG
jgi:hypothetical protein